MAPYIYNRLVHDDEFVQRVRRHAPSSLVPTIARLSAMYPGPDDWLRSPFKKYTAWNLAEVARVSLVYGNESRGLATDKDVMACCAAYTALGDPDLRNEATLDSFAKFMLRMSSEQLVHQVPVGGDLARSIALFEQTVPSRPLEVLENDWAKLLLGCSVTEYVGVAFLIYVGALKSNGTFSFEWLNRKEFAPIINLIDQQIIRNVAETNFVASPDEVRKLEPKRPPSIHPDLRRFLFNPLLSRPVIESLVDDLVVPVPSMLARKASPLGLYYTGVQRWGDKFARDLGTLFEDYIGRQLRLLPDATVYPSITYGRDNRESVDWIVVFNDGVNVLVEVKSTRPSESVRIGDDRAVADLRKSLSKAVRQISNTAQLIRERHPAFWHIPNDRTTIGLVVTMEPFHVINAQPYRDLLPSCSEPVVVCSAFELEGITAINDGSASRVLREHVEDPVRMTYSLGSSIPGKRENVILRQAWECMPWFSLPDVRDHNNISDL